MTTLGEIVLFVLPVCTCANLHDDAGMHYSIRSSGMS